MEKVIIIGTGCAGWTSAIYTGRANLSPLVLAGDQPGGQLTTTTEVENYPGFPEGMMGPELMMKMQEQATKFGARVEYKKVDSVKKNSQSFSIFCGDQEYESETVIVATGAAPRHLGLEGEEKLIGHGLTSCATCDGAFYRDVPVAVIGGGDSACEEATFLTRFASKVYLIHRRDELRASKIMAERALDNEKIEPVWDSQVTEYLTDDDGEMKAVKVINIKTNEEKELDLKCVFVAIGHVPNAQFLQGLVDTDENGYIIQVPGCTKTNVEGLFAAGDVADHVYRQAITAAGDGCKAALEAERYLAENE
ncbi:MAG: thioredoxin-disulfide reductase [Verrucomicrobiales bacterium]|jgi:thioredoxin reductase (NADPH)|nr:thioredoxin-disulfide reductase [Verrucomicrobiales bacterium]MDC0066084.1 thioredoxin-disulfide reductase [Verrucomicrobiota bacterium]OUU85222.1 MAG: thioredoxin-disulfide reductase [Verrucomicrobiaceae bacterium TMED76]RCL32859.1 MAG: thioredoxin-disulfide reductase [Verrucomicrobiota bacterium]|tara:strand:+ start:144 stop:1067 length:924 start_codon:yes stop_codon:yes gene_type:complete